MAEWRINKAQLSRLYTAAYAVTTDADVSHFLTFSVPESAMQRMTNQVTLTLTLTVTLTLTLTSMQRMTNQM